MANQKQAMLNLRDKVKAGDIDGGLDPHFERGLYPTYGMSLVYQAGDAYNGSLDAAKALHEAVLPGWGWQIWGGSYATLSYDFDGAEIDVDNSHEDNPARAWLLAILEALIAQGGEK
jgi:hypothetical protein